MDGIADFYVHSATVETLEGTGAYGDVYGSAQVVECFADSKIRLVRDKTGEQVVSSTTLYMAPADGLKFLPDSRVTVSGTVSYVITQDINDAPGLLDDVANAAVTLQ